MVCPVVQWKTSVYIQYIHPHFDNLEVISLWFCQCRATCGLVSLINHGNRLSQWWERNLTSKHALLLYWFQHRRSSHIRWVLSWGEPSVSSLVYHADKVLLQYSVDQFLLTPPRDPAAFARSRLQKRQRGISPGLILYHGVISGQ